MTRFYGGLCCESDRRLVWCARNWCYRTRRAVGVSDSSGVLVNGRSYRLTVHVGVAGGQPPTPARVLLVGADRAVCVTDRLPAGAVSTLRCTVAPTELGERGLRIQVLVG